MAVQPEQETNPLSRRLRITRQTCQGLHHPLLDMWQTLRPKRPLASRPRNPSRPQLRTTRGAPLMQRLTRKRQGQAMNPPLADRGVGSNSKPAVANLPMPYARRASLVEGVRLPLGHGNTEDWSWARKKSGACRTQTCARCRDSWGLEGAADAGVCVGVGGFGCDSEGTENFGQGWVCVLGDLLDGWSETSERVARHSVDDQVVFKLRHHRRAGTLVGVGCRASLVYQSERSDRDPSSGQADRSDGRTEHSMDVAAGFHSFGSRTSRFGRDKGGK